MSSLPVTETSPEKSRERAQPGLGGLAAALALAGLLVALYWKVLPPLVTQWWDDPNYSHGFLVPLFSRSSTSATWVRTTS
jgi:hypothetical protein